MGRLANSFLPLFIRFSTQRWIERSMLHDLGFNLAWWDRRLRSELY